MWATVADPCYNEAMAIRKVARLGTPVLRRVADIVPTQEITSPAVQSLIDDLIETMHEYDGAGLAAPQVHESLQIVVFEVAGNPRYPEAPSIPLTILINPVVEPITDKVEEDWEGCLSLPDLRGRVPRPTSVAVRAADRNGTPIEFEASGFHARVIQHECDHLFGFVFPDRMTSMQSLTFVREHERYGS